MVVDERMKHTAKDSSNNAVFQPFLSWITGRWALGFLAVASLLVWRGGIGTFAAALSNNNPMHAAENKDSILFDRKYFFKNRKEKDEEETTIDVNDIVFDTGPGPKILSTTFEGYSIEMYGTKNTNNTAKNITYFYVGKNDSFVRTDIDENGRISSVSNSEDGFSLDIDWTSSTTAVIVVGYNGTLSTSTIDTQAPVGTERDSSEPPESPGVPPRTAAADLTLQVSPSSSAIVKEGDTVDIEELKDSVAKSTDPSFGQRRVVLQLNQCGIPYDGANVRLCYTLIESAQTDCTWGYSDPRTKGRYVFGVDVEPEIDTTKREEACEYGVQASDVVCKSLLDGGLSSASARAAFCARIRFPKAVAACAIALTTAAIGCKVLNYGSTGAEEACSFIDPVLTIPAERWNLEAKIYFPVKYFNSNVVEIKGATIPPSFFEDFNLGTYEIDESNSASIESITVSPSAPVAGKSYTLTATVQCVAAVNGEYVSMKVVGTDAYNEQAKCTPPTTDSTQCVLEVPGAAKGVYDRITVGLEPDGEELIYGVFFN